MYSWNDKGWEEYICEDCFDDRVKALTRNELAAMLGSRCAAAEDMGTPG